MTSLLTPTLNNHIHQAIDKVNHSHNGNLDRWQAALQRLSTVNPAPLHNDNGCLTIDVKADPALIKQALTSLLPWRKGPFKIGDVYIDSEWRSNLKWQRINPYLTDVQNKTILDVGGGNGYFSHQLALLNPKAVVCLEPFLLFYYQFLAINTLISKPLPIIFCPEKLAYLNAAASFDIVLSMGVLYHQKSPIEHLLMLKNTLKQGGQLLLETLVIDGEQGYHLMPPERYAKMRNVWFIPSVPTLITWLRKCGFNDIEVVNINQTSINEQRRTPWLGDNAQSLKDFLNPDNSNQTIEGHPAPKRAIVLAKR